MSQTPDPKRDELEDRLVDQALREVLGGEAPPELSDQILAAAEKQGLVSPQHKEKVMDKSKRGYRLWALCAVAACLVAGIGILVVSTRPPQLALQPDAQSTGERADHGDDSGSMAPGGETGEADYDEEPTAEEVCFAQALQNKDQKKFYDDFWETWEDY